MTTRGERLRAYLLAKTGGSSGWQKRLVERSGVKRQTISKWTSPEFDRYPDLETLAELRCLFLHDLVTEERNRVAALLEVIEREVGLLGGQFWMEIRSHSYLVER